MNHTYCLVWNDQTQRRVPAPESARGRGKSKGQALKPAALLLGAAILLPAFAQAAGTLAANALPTGAQVVAGQAGVAQSGSQMTVTQGSDKAIINWQSFNIGSNAAVQFIQPSTSAVALNRVIAGDASQIHGKLSANGQVWLINLNGVLFGKGSQVDVGGLVASTLSITDADFLAGKAVFSRNGAKGGIVNQGEITAADGGLVALLAPTVSNEGIVTARLGSVVMAAGDRITLDAGANGLLQVAVDPATVKTLIENKQLIVADGGQAIMTGKAADALSASVVANTGTIQARSIAAREGRILLIADMEHGETQVGGTLDASAPAGGNGGFIETSAAHVTVANSALITTKAASGQSGTWLIDPNDFTIAASGGNMTGAAVSAALQNNGNFTIETATQGTAGGNGDIRVNDAVTWSANSTLTLKAERNIDINAVVSVNGDGKLAMNYGSAGNINTPGFSGRVNFEKSGSGLLTVNGQGYDVIKDVTALQAINSGLGGKYALGADIDVGNFTPIGDNSTDSDASRFTGTFDGLGHVIRNLVIDQPAMRFVGLFGATGNSSVIRNVGLEGGSVKGGYVVGGLVGYNMGRISASYATGSVSASALTFNDSAAGGLVGRNSGSISASYATGTVSASASGGGNASAGGLVGGNNGSIGASYATGSVNASASGGGFASAGGLVGENHSGGSIAASYATGPVSASASGGGYASAGGLVGYNAGSIGASYATGPVSASTSDGDASAGGLVGENVGSISASYATGSVSASPSGFCFAYAGGLVGYNGGSIGDSYATGSVSASGDRNAYAGGLVGENVGSISASYATGSAIASGGSLNRAGGLVGVGDNGGTITGAFYATTDVNGNVINHGGVADGDWSGNALGTGKSLADLKKAGTFAAWGAKVDDRGGSGAVWRIYEGNTTPLLRSFLTALTVDAGTLADRVYDGSAASGTVGSYTPSVSGAQPAGSLSYTAVSKNAGTYRTSDGSLRLGGLYSDQRGYDISYAGSSLTVTPAALTVTTGAVTKTYDGTTAAAGSAIASAGTQLFGGDTLSGGSFAFTDRNAGSGKTVRVSGVTINDGNGGNNYTVTYADNTASTIDKAALTVTTGAVTKTYDGTTAAAGSAIVSGGQLFGDTLSGGSFAFTDRNAGSGKTVRVSGVTINDGNGGNNYTVTYADNTASAIDKAALTVTTGAVTKTYDGTTAAAGSAIASAGTQLFGGDTFSGGSFAFTDRNAGSGKTVTVANVTVNDGNGGNNYTVSYADNTASTIAKAALTVTAADASKTEGSVLAFTGTEFTTGGGQLKNGETLVRADLSSSGAPAAARAGRYAIEGSNAQGGNGFDAGNYDIAYVNGILSVAAKAGASENLAPSGGTIWRNQANEANRASSPERPGQAGGSGQALAGANPFLTLAPVFIRARGEE